MYRESGILWENRNNQIPFFEPRVHTHKEESKM